MTFQITSGFALDDKGQGASFLSFSFPDFGDGHFGRVGGLTLGGLYVAYTNAETVSDLHWGPEYGWSLGGGYGYGAHVTWIRHPYRGWAFVVGYGLGFAAGSGESYTLITPIPKDMLDPIQDLFLDVLGKAPLGFFSSSDVVFDKNRGRLVFASALRREREAQREEAQTIFRQMSIAWPRW